MEFLHPYYLFGLVAIAIPVIIHLFNFRRYKKLYFTNLKFLKSIKNETKKQHRLRHILILISRILAICCLVIAFARPYIPGPGGLRTSAERYVSIYVDNSMSMQAAPNGMSLLDVARAKAAEVVSSYGPSDRFQLLTNDFQGKHQRFYNRDEFMSLLSEVLISPQHRMLPVVHERMQETELPLEEVENHQYYISDFQRSSYGAGLIDPDTSAMHFYIPVINNPYGNLYIDSCWFESPYNHVFQHQELHLRLVNASDIDLEKIPVRLTLGGIQRAIATFDAPAMSGATVKLPFTNNEKGIQTAIVSIEDFPLTWDDSFYLGWVVKDRIPVMAIGEQESGFYYSSLFGKDSLFEYTDNQVRNLDYSLFPDADLIVLDNIVSLSSGLAEELRKYLASGGSLLLVPGMDANIDTYNSFLSGLNMGRLLPFDTAKLFVTGLNTKHEIFADVFEKIPENLDLPMINGHFPMSNYRADYHDVIMDLQNGDPYLILGKYEKGKVYTLTAPLGDDHGDLARHAVWVPLMYRMAMLSRPQGHIYYTMGLDHVINTGLDRLPEDQQLLMKLKDETYEFIPAVQHSGLNIDLMLFDRISEAGHYELSANGELLAGFSFNYDRHESDPAIYTDDELEEMLSDQNISNVLVVDSATEQVSRAVSELSQGTGLWKLFIWLALCFILMEILLLRLYRK